MKNYTYNNNGNIKEDGNQKYYYDYKNRLVRVTNISGTQIKAEYRYDVLGRRYQKTISSKITSYVYSGENILQESYSGMGPGGRGSCLGILLINVNYINGIGVDEILGYDYQENDKTIQCTLNRYYVYKDNKGSIDGVKLDTTGMIFLPGTPVPQPLIYEYDEYGKAYVVSGTSRMEYDTYTGNTYGNKRLFTGREYDKEIGLYYYRARYYDSKIGRFISRDPIDIADDVNLYGYVGNNPVNYNDPSGLKEKALVIIADDKDEGNYEFDKNGYLLNSYNSAIRQQYNTLKRKNINIEYKFIYTFEEFDNIINNTKSNNIYLLGHGNPDVIALKYKNGISSDRITSKELSNDIQTREQTISLRNKTLTTYACNSGNIDIGGENTIAQQIANHYGFRSVSAPSKYAHGNLEIYNEENKNISIFGRNIFEYKVKNMGEMNLFTN